MADRFVVDTDGTVSLKNLDSFFHLLEYGSAKNRAEAPLRRAVQETPGVRLKENE
jgi:hypothetical protein